MPDGKPSFLFGVGSIIVGGFTAARGVKELVDLKKAKAPLGLVTPANGDVIKTVQTVQVNTIEQRVHLIRKLIRSSSADPKIREKALSVLTRKCRTRDGDLGWCVPEKDWDKEVVALFQTLKNPNSKWAMRYVRDHVSMDQFTSAQKNLVLNGGDCDDMTITLGAMLMSVGYPVKMRVIQARGSSTWSHIYLVVGLPPGRPGKWVPLDLAVSKPPGWEVPRRMVVRTRDFPV